MKKIEYSQIVRKKLNQLKVDLVQDFGAEVSRKSVKKITDAVRGLEKFEKKGIAVSAMYNIECDYRYLYVSHNYVTVLEVVISMDMVFRHIRENVVWDDSGDIYKNKSLF